MTNSDFDRAEVIEAAALTYGIPEAWVENLILANRIMDEDLEADSTVLDEILDAFTSDDDEMREMLAEELGLDEEALRVYCEYHGFSAGPDLTPDYFDQNMFEETYNGTYDSEADFAESFWTDCIGIPDDTLARYIDWEEVWNGELSYDYHFEDGHVFRTSY